MLAEIKFSKAISLRIKKIDVSQPNFLEPLVAQRVLANRIAYCISFSKTMDQPVVLGGLIFGKLFSVLLERLLTDTDLAYHISKDKEEIASDLLFGDDLDYDQHIQGKAYRNSFWMIPKVTIVLIGKILL